jgi:hypothetical protein
MYLIKDGGVMMIVVRSSCLIDYSFWQTDSGGDGCRQSDGFVLFCDQSRCYILFVCLVLPLFRLRYIHCSMGPVSPAERVPLGGLLCYGAQSKNQKSRRVCIHGPLDDWLNIHVHMHV